VKHKIPKKVEKAHAVVYRRQSKIVVLYKDKLYKWRAEKLKKAIEEPHSLRGAPYCAWVITSFSYQTATTAKYFG
jgi:hypothetical protein